eukprot:m.289918 g.289918  ORF g.289918 m.289918 type:complete len:72 (-) comp15812_c1_seq1:22-237(-)
MCFTTSYLTSRVTSDSSFVMLQFYQSRVWFDSTNSSVKVNHALSLSQAACTHAHCTLSTHVFLCILSYSTS